ncbi:MAG TPA: GGDEF domain-containing protein, partial [Gemmatimonadales bacterium]
VTAGLATVLWTLVDVTGRPVRSQPGLIVWNAAVELMFFSGLAILVSFMARQADNLRSLAREDALTGVANRRAFFGALTNAVDLAGRREGAWTITYVDLDDFKQINDRLGHNTGDDVLRAVAGTLKAATRRVDVVARLGGDEFGVLMPDTDQAQAETAVRKLQALLDAAMTEGGWPITFSIGATTFLAAPASPDAALAVADAQMYEVKHESKAAVRFGVWDGRTVGR